jgi:hypothetical protein
MPDLIKIGDIPTAITDNHNEVLRYWKGKNRTLFHIDAHDDMADGVHYQENTLKSYYDKVHIANFICPAVHFKVVSDMYWLNPHKDEKTEKRLLYFGDDGARLETKLSPINLRTRPINAIKWELVNQWHMGRNIYDHNIDIQGDYILDIDLDAFCCINGCANTKPGYDSEEGYEQRIDQTMGSLSKLKAPKIITIARSIGFLDPTCGDYTKCFIPHDNLEEVEQLTLNGLRKLYE